MRRVHLATLVALGAAAAAIQPAYADPFSPVQLIGAISVPSDAANTQPGGVFSSFDISFVDPTTGYDYVADRSNAAVDVFGGTSFLGRTDPVFTGQQPTTSASGPDGVLTVSNGGQHTLFAGNGNSTLLSFDISSGTLPPPQQFAALNTGGTHRVDEMAYSPTANLVLVANNADTPAFATLVHADTGLAASGKIVVSGAVGLEQPAWDPGTGTFFVSVPQLGSSGPGGVAEIDTSGNVVHIYDFSRMGITGCSPTGLAVGGSGHLVVGCGDSGTQTIVLDPTANGGNGAIVTTLSQISGSDELWYNPTTAAFYVTGFSGGLRAFDVFSDATDSLLQSVLLPGVAAHSIAVNPFNNDVYVPLPAGAANTICAGGCVAVYGVPEPGSLPLLATGMISLIGLALRRRFSPAAAG